MSREYEEYLGLECEKADLEKSGDFSSARYVEIEGRMSELFRDMSASEREWVNGGG